MSRLITLAIFGCCTLSAWQQPAARPNFTGLWQLDSAKSKSEIKEELVWKIDHKGGDIVMEEISAGKTSCNAKCSIGKICEFDDLGKKMNAMTYFLNATLVQMRNTIDNASVIKRHLKMEEDGSLRVELVTIVPADKTEVLIFNKQKPSGADVKAAAATDPPKP